MEGIYISDTNELTFTNTFLLSNSGLSLGYGLIIWYVYRLHFLLYVISTLLALTFITIQIKEFLDITLYMNESIYISAFFSLIGFHLFHVVVGIVLLVPFYCYFDTWCSSRSKYNFYKSQLRVTPHLLISTLQLVYWHFVDIVWLFIYSLLYN